MKLTKTQKIAVDETRTNVIVSAGAGTGKTRVLVERFVNLVAGGQAVVSEILALTFTEKAANEMKKRILGRLKELNMNGARRELETAYISTLHAFAARLLKEHPVEAGVSPDFRVIEGEESALLEEIALDEIIEADCVKGSPAFNLLKTYGEETVRGGIRKLFHEARTNGLTLTEYLIQSHTAELGEEHRLGIGSLFEKVGEKQLAADWQDFWKIKGWTWEDSAEFKSWMKPFSRRGGKADKADWKEITKGAQLFLASRTEFLAIPVKADFEKLALAFEVSYEAKKFEKGVLDFDDLQLKALRLFKKEKPANQKLLDHYRRHFKFIMVDEFQDTNPMQTEFVELLAGGKNLFFVGDFKQSIYGFRGTEPAHFLRKESAYSDAKEGLRISMMENFRSQPEVLQFINEFFSELWAEDSIQLEELAAFSSERTEASVELLRTEQSWDESINDARMREAQMIAQRMLELAEQGTPYGDMAILFQAMSSVAIYEQAMKRAGIPYFVISGRGFYHQPEIRDVMSFLACLENPLSDIPLAAALRSPFFQVTDDTLFWLARNAKLADEMAPLFNALKSFESIQEIPESEKEKLRRFNTLLEELLAEKDRLRLAELLDVILEKTNYELAVLTHPQGVRKLANLRKLIGFAREYEELELMPLGNFIRTIRHLELREIRESEAQVEAEESGKVVRIMTIHAAKGLEFPVCFVADLAHSGKNQDSKTFAASRSAYSFQIQNPITLEWEEPLTYRLIDKEKSRRESEEWKRLFYVAATRAKSRLILCGVHKEKKKEKESFHEMSSWMEWVTAILDAGGKPSLNSVVVWEQDKKRSGKPRLVPAEKKAFLALLENFSSQPPETLYESAKERRHAEERAARILENIAGKKIPSARVIDLPVSAYAAFQKNPEEFRKIYLIGYPESALRGRAEESVKREELETFDPAEAALSASDFGTLIHRALELYDFKNPEEPFRKPFHSLFRGLDETQLAEAAEILKNFSRSPLALQLKRAKRIYRELPFVLNERHGRIDGVIDLAFEDESGRWHVVDYKTAVGDEAKVKKAAYDLQIALYAAALYRISGIAADTGVLYFLKNQWVHTEKLTEARLKEALERIRGIQESILDFTYAGGG